MIVINWYCKFFYILSCCDLGNIYVVVIGLYSQDHRTHNLELVILKWINYVLGSGVTFWYDFIISDITFQHDMIELSIFTFWHDIIEMGVIFRHDIIVLGVTCRHNNIKGKYIEIAYSTESQRIHFSNEPGVEAWVLMCFLYIVYDYVIASVLWSLVLVSCRLPPTKCYSLFYTITLCILVTILSRTMISTYYT